MPDPIVTVMSETASEVRGERERSLALDAVLSHGAELGVDAALERFGAAMTPTEKELVRSLSQDDLKSLHSIRGRLGGLGRLASDNNNNIL